MTDDRTSRSRRLSVSAAAVMAFGLLGVGATGYALSQQVGPAPQVATEGSGHAGHGAVAASPSATPTSSTGATGGAHAGHGAQAPQGSAYETPKGPGIFRLRDHLERMERSAKIFMIDIPYSCDELTDAIHGLIEVHVREELVKMLHESLSRRAVSPNL